MTAPGVRLPMLRRARLAAEPKNGDRPRHHPRCRTRCAPRLRFARRSHRLHRHHPRTDRSRLGPRRPARCAAQVTDHAANPFRQARLAWPPARRRSLGPCFCCAQRTRRRDCAVRTRASTKTRCRPVAAARTARDAAAARAAVAPLEGGGYARRVRPHRRRPRRYRGAVQDRRPHRRTADADRLHKREALLQTGATVGTTLSTMRDCYRAAWALAHSRGDAQLYYPGQPWWSRPGCSSTCAPAMPPATPPRPTSRNSPPTSQWARSSSTTVQRRQPRRLPAVRTARRHTVTSRTRRHRPLL